MRRRRRRTHIKIGSTDAVYVIGIVSELLDMPEWTLRTLEKEGLISPKRQKTSKNRFYSLDDIEKLEYIQYLMEEEGVNINGIKLLLEIKEEE